jgi:hypothetical protein
LTVRAGIDPEGGRGVRAEFRFSELQAGWYFSGSLPLLAVDASFSSPIGGDALPPQVSRLGQDRRMRPPLPNPLPAFDPIPQMVIEAAKRLFITFRARAESAAATPRFAP